MFRTVRLSIIRSLFTVHSAMVYVLQVCRQLSSRSTGPVRKLSVKVCEYLLRVQWINSWWWTKELSGTCKVSWQNKFVKLVYLIGFITEKVSTHSWPWTQQKLVLAPLLGCFRPWQGATITHREWLGQAPIQCRRSEEENNKVITSASYRTPILWSSLP